MGVAVIGLGGILYFQLRRPERTAAIRGQEIAWRLGCFACHGPEGTGGIANPGSLENIVPAWDIGADVIYHETEDEIREWILYGVSQRFLAVSEETAGGEEEPEPLVPMPAYEGLLSSQELDDLVAYFQAVSWYEPEMPENAYEGKKIAARTGCFGCHGPGGHGGVPNPGSFKGFIPPWDGRDFGKLVRNEEELREWILDGTISRLEANPLARYFLKNQKTPMPAYREHLSKEDVDKIVAYIQWLRRG
ncbi:MAG: c-type cytochrome [Acidobacteriota bacterium]|nr:MAG: c-type cytochrome [Acidobacteriota bacterium]